MLVVKHHQRYQVDAVVASNITTTGAMLQQRNAASSIEERGRAHLLRLESSSLERVGVRTLD